MGQLKISIAICTYNRHDLLKLNLEGFLQQSNKLENYEILVIDNNSTDNTANLVKDLSKNIPQLKYIFEPNQGLSYARNTAYKNALADYVAYLDDDAIPSENWVEEAVNIIKNYKPDIFGGTVYPYHLSPVPEWFKEEYEIRQPQKHTGWMADGSHISAMNIVFKKDLLEEFGGFTISRGMTANQLVYGDETEIITHAHKTNRKLFFSQELTVKHFVPDYKKTIAFFIYGPYKMGKDSNHCIEGRNYTINDIYSLPKLIDDTFEKFGSKLKTVQSGKAPYLESFIIENTKADFNKIGGIVEAFKENPKLNIISYINHYTNVGKKISGKELLTSIKILMKIFIQQKFKK